MAICNLHHSLICRGLSCDLKPYWLDSLRNFVSGTYHGNNLRSECDMDGGKKICFCNPVFVLLIYGFEVSNPLNVLLDRETESFPTAAWVFTVLDPYSYLFLGRRFPRIHSKQMLKSQSIKLKPWHRIILFGSRSIQLIFINNRQLSMVLLVVLVFVFGYMLCDNYQLQPESFLPRVFCAFARLLF